MEALAEAERKKEEAEAAYLAEQRRKAANYNDVKEAKKASTPISIGEAILALEQKYGRSLTAKEKEHILKQFMNKK